MEIFPVVNSEEEDRPRTSKTGHEKMVTEFGSTDFMFLAASPHTPPQPPYLVPLLYFPGFCYF